MTTVLTAIDSKVRWAYRQPKNNVFRRLDIYEADGETLWYPGIDTERLISGTINISYDRDERRQLNGLVLANYDGILNYDPNGFWYDKILKIYRGIRFIYEGEDYEYQCQVGEFMIDKMSDPKFPHTIVVNGRDYTKKLLVDKLPEATSFEASRKVDDVIWALAYNGGIRKFRLSGLGFTLGSTLVLDKDISRWEGIKKAAKPFGLDVYFSNDGYLTVRMSSDVSTSAPFISFGEEETQDGATRAERSVSDSNIYNDLVVRSSNSEAETAGIAPMVRWSNNDPDSPTSIQRIGRRSDLYESELFLNKSDVDAYLAIWKRTASLETWDMNFGFRFLPWIEVGKVIELPDIDNSKVPSRYLLTDLDAPVGLGTVSGTAKRLTIVE